MLSLRLSYEISFIFLTVKTFGKVGFRSESLLADAKFLTVSRIPNSVAVQFAFIVPRLISVVFIKIEIFGKIQFTDCCSNSLSDV